MISKFDFTGKRYLITGASSGMGAQIAQYLSQLGASLILTARREDKLCEVVNSLAGHEHKYYGSDLQQVETVEPLMERIIDENGPLDGLVYCAGNGKVVPIRMAKYKYVQQIMSVNYFSFIEMVRCLVKNECCNDGTNIVGISSTSAQRAAKTQTVYAASKAAMDASVRSLAKELAERNIRINTIAPAIIKTDSKIYKDFVEQGAGSEDLKMMFSRQYLGEGTPLDVAYMVAFLLSDMSRMITGATIAIDGGMLSS